MTRFIPLGTSKTSLVVPSRPATIRVASVPASHVYVRHLSDPDRADGVIRLPDVPPADGVHVPGGWWPPAMLDAEWIAGNYGSFDVFHVHFGFDAKTPEELGAVAHSLQAADVPLIVTVHDLRNPHHPERALHDAQLEVLLEHAAAVITLTPGAARAIDARWGVKATVMPHPHVVEPEVLVAPRSPHGGFVVGLHAKSLRANMDVLGVARALAAAVCDLPDARLQIDVHDEIFERGNHFYDPEVGAQLRRLAAAHGAAVELREHAYFNDEELWDYLLGVDASVLPYRFGTHSGWLEACYDLGTAIVAPTCGFYAEQQRCWSYDHDEHGLDAVSLTSCVRRAYEQRPGPRADAESRRRERRMLAAAHRELYERLAR